MANDTDPTPPAVRPAAPRALPLGTMLDECEIDQVLAQSGFAVLYRAYDPALTRHVAIKEYLPDALALRGAQAQVVLRAPSHAASFELGLRAFIREAQTLARCEHPSLLRVNRILQRHGTAYRVMPHYSGMTLLEHRRSQTGAPGETTLRAWLDGLLGALAALHGEGCVHGAVAPGNILLLPADRPLLLDFDAVRRALISDRTHSLMTALEPGFLPIEQRSPSQDSALGPWTDLYALAATLRFCIGGDLPASSSQATQSEPMLGVWQRAHAGQPESQAPLALLSALDACLAPAATDRPQSVARLREMLAAPPVIRPAPVEAAPLPATVQDAEAPPVLPPPPPPASVRPTTPPIAEPAQPEPLAPPLPAGHEPERHADTELAADLEQTYAFIATKVNEEASTALAAAANAATPPVATPTQPLAPRLARRRWLDRAGLAAAALLAVGAWWLSQQDSPPAREIGATMEAPRAVGKAAPLSPPPDPPPSAGPRAANSASTEPLTTPLAPVASPLPEASTATRSVAEVAAPASATPAPPEPPTPTPALAARAPASPRASCGTRSGYALYRCMQTQCAKRDAARHPQCLRFRQTQRLD